MKRRILNKDLAQLIAQIKPGEMIFIANALSGISDKALYPLDESVQYIDLEAVSGSPSFRDIVITLTECGDFDEVIITREMTEFNEKDYATILDLFGPTSICIIQQIPEYYQIRDRCRAVVQTGDYGYHAQAIIVAGYPDSND